MRIAIIGSGMAGLACARRLAEGGLAPVVFDKGRGIGGRMATRRTEDGLRFDHGAQYITAKSEGFRRLLAEAQHAGAVGLWDAGPDKQRFVGTPGMTALPRHLGRGLEIRQNAEVSAIRETDGGWQISLHGEAHEFDRLVLTIPAPQAATLLGDHPLSEDLAHVAYEPCMTLMAAFPPGAEPPWPFRLAADDPLAWIAADATKPGRSGSTWVAQAGAEWSASHQDDAKDALAALMLPMLAEVLRLDPATALYAAGHRWRYARVTQPLGKPFTADDKGRLYLGGDWCLGARVEAAWQSGTAIADGILES